jgi:DNA-binding IclR family transcriptional regulator
MDTVALAGQPPSDPAAPAAPEAGPADPPRPAPASQTLDRGLRVLEHLIADGRAHPVTSISRSLGLHRSIVLRLLSTLVDHHLVVHEPHGYRAGPGVLLLADHLAGSRHQALREVLGNASRDLRTTVFAVQADGDECLTVACVEPHRGGVTLVQRPGVRHSIRRGAPGVALLAALGDTLSTQRLAAIARERLDEALATRARGWVMSDSDVIPGVKALAVPVREPLGPASAVATVYVGESLTPGGAAPVLTRCAREVALLYRRGD